MFEKFFIKDYKNINNSKVRNKYGILAAIFGITSNILLFILKIVIGILSHSITIISDAFNSLSDSISSIITLLGFKLMNKKPTQEHPYGYARYEYIANMLVSIFMIVIAILFIKESIGKIFNPAELNISNITFIILIISIIIKILQYIVYKNIGNKINSDTLITVSHDSLNDIINTSAIIFSMIIMNIFKINIDGYVGLIISIYIIISSLLMLKNAIDPLIGGVPSKEEINFITKKLLSYDSILGIHDLIIHNYGYNQDFVTVHVEIDANTSFLDAHKIADFIEEDFYNKLGINITIHMDPVELDNPLQNKLKIKIENILKTIDNEISIHDFRLTNNKIIFDVVLPYDINYEEKDLVRYLKSNINKNYKYEIKIDRPMY